MNTKHSCSTGHYRGEFFRRVPLNTVFEFTDRKPNQMRALWWVMDDGNHFKTLRELKAYIDETKGPRTA
jgi:hypothetical protein